MKKLNSIVIAVAIMTVIVAAYFLFSVADMIAVLIIIGLLVTVMTAPMSDVKESKHRMINADVKRNRR